MWTLILLLILSSGMAYEIIRTRKYLHSATFSAPIFVFLISIFQRVGLGSALIAITPNNLVLAGEYGQYQITRTYIEETSQLWCIYLAGFLAGIGAITYINSTLTRRNRVLRIYWGRIERKIVEAEPRVGPDGNTWLFYILLVLSIFFLAELVVGFSTGSIDRGLEYKRWALENYKPTGAFVGLSRLKWLMYLVIPSFLKIEDSRWKVYLIIALASIPPVFWLLTGSRGEFLYPVLMIVCGSIYASKKKLRLIRRLLPVGIVLILMVPFLGAYRESTSFYNSGLRSAGGRVSAIFQVDSDRLVYRWKALGREVYACSDAYILKEKNGRQTGFGFSDLGTKKILSILTPRFLMKDRSYKKYDGSAIAKQLMGSSEETWFPCIYTPADIYRRTSFMGVFIGGVLMALLLGCLSLVWQGLIAWTTYPVSFLVLVYPLTYIQSPLSGTVQELIWYVFLEIPKYIVVVMAVNAIYRLFQKIRLVQR